MTDIATTGTGSGARTAPADPDALLRIAVAQAALGVAGVHRLGRPAGRALASARAATVGGSTVTGVRLTDQDGVRALQVTIVVTYPKNVVDVAGQVRDRVAAAASGADIASVDVVVSDVYGPFDRAEEAQDPQDVQPRDGAVQRAGDAAGKAAQAAGEKAAQARDAAGERASQVRAAAGEKAAEVRVAAGERAAGAKVAAAEAADAAGERAAAAKTALSEAVDDAGEKAAQARAAAARAVDAAAAAADASSARTAAAVTAAPPAPAAVEPVVVVVADPSGAAVVGAPGEGGEDVVLVESAVVEAPVVEAPVVEAPVVEAPVVARPSKGLGRKGGSSA